MLRRPLARRPIGRGGLIGTAARTAVVAGTATAVSGRVAHGQQQRAEQAAAADAFAQQQQQAPPPPPQSVAPPPPADSTVAELERLASLQAQGLLTPDEFSAAKAKLLGIG